MKHKTYQCLRRAYLGHVDRKALRRVMERETDPFVNRAAQLVTKETHPWVPWDSEIFTTQFRNGSPQERLEETVMTFLLRLVAIIKEEIHLRTFGKPASQDAIQAWLCLFKKCVYVVLTLLYNVQWSLDLVFQLDQLVLDLVFRGKVKALRDFMMEDLQIAMTTTMTQAEQGFDRLNYLNIFQFGSSFWRLLHWMAEAMDMRQAPEAKRQWRELITGSLYRLLRCFICMSHLRKIVDELKPQLLDESTRYRELWFNIHNRVTAQKMHGGSSLYSESQFEEDSAFMRQALVV